MTDVSVTWPEARFDGVSRVLEGQPSAVFLDGMFEITRSPLPGFQLIATPTVLQLQTFELLDVSHRLRVT